MALVTITLDEDVKDRLDNEARSQGGRSTASLIREAIEEKLERHEAKTEPEQEELAA